MARNERVRIPMTDGVSLSATLFFPETDDAPWPVIMEALPYRKDDAIAGYDGHYADLADHGYVSVRLDIRGTGSSGGITTDEYSADERRDLVEVIDWLATQTWSSGNVGMFGTSYGGFNSLQAALENPPALKAIVPIFASDDRYNDDVHYYGGALKHVDLVDYPTYMVAMNALPPVPRLWGADWRDEWQRRLEQTEPWLLTWLAHQRRDAYWLYGSAREDIASITAATMIIGGWADGYTNIALRSFERMQAPVRLLIGPWSHGSPETCRPGPNIDGTAEIVRWFDRWLKDEENGIDEEPPVVVYQQRSTRPDPLRNEVRGEWRSEPAWPPKRLGVYERALGDAEPGGLAGEGPTDALTVAGDVGATAWISCAGGLPWGQSADQRPDEERSLTYTWEPLTEDLEVFGHPYLRVTLRSDRPIAYLSAKITDVFPDGASSLVVRGMTNIAHQDEPVVPGESFEIDLELEAIAWTFEAGHQVRLDLAGADWPNAWPPPYAATLSIDRPTATLELPVLDGSPVADPPSVRVITGNQHSTESTEDGWWRWEVDEPRDGMHIARTGYGSTGADQGDARAYRDRYEGTVGASTTDPGVAFADGECEFELAFPEATVRTYSHVRVDSTAEAYTVAIELTAFEDGAERFTKRWDRIIPRDGQ
ncbi:MAG TPA: CocE/NonD family hydrolase [Actinomycetota bacterium]|nr:CocE/NonD family hydrolase [Actinomycetota bacterium]